MRKRIISSIQGRVLLALFLLAMIPLLIVAYQGYHCARQAVEDLARLHLVSVAESRKAMVETWYAERLGDLEILAAIPALSELTQRPASGASAQKSVENLLKRIKESEIAFDRLSVYDNAWQLVGQTEVGPHQTMDLLNEGLMERAEGASGTVLGEPHLHAGGMLGAHVVRPVFDDAGAKTGYLVANLDLTSTIIPHLQKRDGLLQSGKTYIVAGDSTIITEPFAGSGSTAHGKAIARSHAPGSGAAVGSSVAAYQDYTGADVLGTVLPLPIADWSLVAEIDSGEALSWLNVLVFRASATVAATLAAALVVSMWLSGLLGKPLKQLATTAHRIREGHHDERVPGSRLSEANEVAEAFNQMLDELRVQQQLLVRNATLASMGELTSSIVHEMRNPLSSVKMNLQALSRSLDTGDPNYEVAAIASAQLHRLETMLSDLLQFGRPIALNMQPIAFDELLRVSIEPAASLLDEKSVSCEVRNELKDRKLCVDREQMCRALSNLIVNAAQASPAGTAVCIRAYSTDAQTGPVHIEVGDSGPGLSPTVTRKLFLPFFTTKSGGTGLGLANVKKIAELHGGTVTAENQDSGGAVFRLTLPGEVGAGDR